MPFGYLQTFVSSFPAHFMQLIGRSIKKNSIFFNIHRLGTYISFWKKIYILTIFIIKCVLFSSTIKHRKRGNFLFLEQHLGLYEFLSYLFFNFCNTNKFVEASNYNFISTSFFHRIYVMIKGSLLFKLNSL